MQKPQERLEGDVLLSKIVSEVPNKESTLLIDTKSQLMVLYGDEWGRRCSRCCGCRRDGLQSAMMIEWC